MNVSELLERISLEVPRGRFGDFRYRLNDQVHQLWSDHYRWPHYISTVEITATHTFSNLTVTNGATTATVVDADAGGLFDALHVGKSFTVSGDDYTVSSVTDADTLVLSTPITTAGSGLSGSLPRVVYSLGATFSRLYGSPYRTDNPYPYDGVYLDSLEEPRDYHLRLVSGLWRMEFLRVLTTSYTARFVRVVTAATGPGSTVDVPSILEPCLYQALLAHYLSRVEARNEVELAQLQVRARDAKAEYARLLKSARGVTGSVGQRVALNKPNGFSTW